MGPIIFMFGVLHGVLGFTVDVGFRTVDGTALAGTDYNSSSQIFGFTGMAINSVPVNLIDDDMLEGVEMFNADLFAVDFLPSNVILSPVRASAKVVDNDDITIGFRPDVYAVLEGGVVNFNITVIRGTLFTDFEIDFFTSEGDVTAPEDYTSVVTTLTFNSNTFYHVVPVMVMNDVLLENEEVFYGNLSLAQGAIGVILMPSLASVTIADNSDAIIGFSGNHTVIEGVAVNLELVVFSGSLAREIVVGVSTADGTALAPLDYIELRIQQLTFAPGQTTAMIQVDTNVDNTVEFNEYFRANAFLVSTASVTIDPEIVFVTIVDNDQVDIGFAPAVYSVFEPDGSVTLTASVLSGMLARPVQVSFFTTDGSATSTSPMDFKASSNLVLEFNAATLSHQVEVTIVDDNILENSEVFYGNLSSTDSAVQLNPASAIVNIMEGIGDDVSSLSSSSTSNQFSFTTGTPNTSDSILNTKTPNTAYTSTLLFSTTTNTVPTTGILIGIIVCLVIISVAISAICLVIIFIQKRKNAESSIHLENDKHEIDTTANVAYEFVEKCPHEREYETISRGVNDEQQIYEEVF